MTYKVQSTWFDRILRRFVPKKAFTDEELKRIASHEVGHLMVYGALKKLPRIQVWIFDPDFDDAAGLVLCLEPLTPTGQEWLEWRMLVDLAGYHGELLAMGEVNPLSCLDDMELWIKRANQYTRDGFEKTPTSIQILMSKQREWLAEFFELNAALHKELSELLMDKKILTCRQVFDHLPKVIIPAGFPNP